MSKDSKGQSAEFKRVLELGAVDLWLRGLADLVPKPSDPDYGFSQERDLHSVMPGIEVAHLDTNVHILPFAAHNIVGDRDIERIRGFQSLMATASQKNVRVDVENVNGDALEVTFDPDEPFSRSRAFGASYANVLPAIFGAGTAVKMKK